MATPFARSLRALDADDHRMSLAIMALAGLLVLAWSLWFLLAPIPIHASATEAHKGRGEVIDARFAPAVLSQLRRGQTATVAFQDPEQVTLAGSAAAVITAIDRRRQTATLYLRRPYPIAWAEAEAAPVAVTLVVRHISPLGWVTHPASRQPEYRPVAP